MEISSSVSTRIHYQHKALIDIIDGLTDEQIRRQVNAGKWSIFETIVHLQTYQHTVIQRVKQLLEGNNPVFPNYTAESDPLFLDNCGRSTREIIQDLLTTRKEMTATMQSYTSTDLQKKGTHAVYGEMNLLEWINFFLLHEAHHLFCIFRMGATLKKNNRTV